MTPLATDEGHHQETSYTPQCYENGLRNSAPCF